jgi:restriction system protein
MQMIEVFLLFIVVTVAGLTWAAGRLPSSDEKRRIAEMRAADEGQWEAEKRLLVWEQRRRTEADERRGAEEEARRRAEDAKKQAEEERKRAAETKLRNVVRLFFAERPRYLDTLVRIRERVVYLDEFGDYKFDEWWRTLETFLDEKMMPSMDVAPFSPADNISRLDIVFAIEKAVDERGTELLAAGLVGGDEPSDTPEDYEQVCSRIFAENGYEAARVGGTGDQGADVIASLGTTRIAVQCKMYSSPVGNAAVQQVEAARRFYDCTQAIVVSDAGFTKSARILANKLGVRLVSRDKLRRFLENGG